MSQLQHQSCLDLVWDCYVKTGSLKTAARAKRGRGTRRRVTATTTIPGNWHDFLRVDDNKQELFSFLSREVTTAINLPEKQLVVTDGQQVISVPICDNMPPWHHAIMRKQTHRSWSIISCHKVWTSQDVKQMFG